MNADGHSEDSRIDLPPPSRARITLPRAFGARFAVFADAEEEFDWTAPFSRDATSTRTISALPQANRFFTERGCVPTYLVDWPVIDTRKSGDIIADLAKAGHCDVGTQLHPWVNPPFDEPVSPENSYISNLPVTLQRAKLALLTARITEVVGFPPRVYRAGRYGIGPATATLLNEHGYRLDVSVRAHFDYSQQHGPDFSHHPVWPWRMPNSLLELPLTAAYIGRYRHHQQLHRLRLFRSLLARGGMIDRVPLTPEGVPLSAALAAIDRLLGDGHQLFSLSFHTPSIEPGHTPYVRDGADLKQFWAWWDGVFALFARKGVMPIRSGEIITALDSVE